MTQDFEDDCRRDGGVGDGGGRRSADDSGVGRRLAAAAVGTAAAFMAVGSTAAAGAAAVGMAAVGRLAWGLLARRHLVQRLVGPGDRRGRDRRRGDRQLPLLGRRLWIWRVWHGGGCWQVRPTYDAYGNFLGQQSVNVC